LSKQRVVEVFGIVGIDGNQVKKKEAGKDDDGDSKKKQIFKK